MAAPSNRKRHVSGGQCKVTEGKLVSPSSKKRFIPGGKTSHQGKIAIKSPVKETNQRKCTPGRVADSARCPQTSQVQSQSVSPAQSVMEVSPLADVLTSPSQSAAAPHSAGLAAVFKEMMDAAEMNQTAVPTMNKIESEYKNRHVALIRPTSPLLSPVPLEAQCSVMPQ